MSRFVAGGAVIEGVSAHVLDRLLRAPANRKVLDAMPAWIRLELAAALDALARSGAAYVARPVAADGSGETAMPVIGAECAVSGNEEPLTTAQAAAVLRVSRRRARQLAAAGLGRLVGSRWLLDRSAVVALAEARGVRGGQHQGSAREAG